MQTFYKKKKPSIAIAMSGGIDSSVAAALLKKQGYNCIGIFMKFWSEAEGRTETPPNGEVGKLSEMIENKCCSEEAFQTARKVTHQLGFPIYTLNFKQPFKKLVVNEFLRQYQEGLTPNPCINCNKFIKFDLLLKKAQSFGCNFLATGHYVKIEPRDKRQATGDMSHVTCRMSLMMAKDKNKDQSYFLYTLKQNQLKHLLFPLGNYTKTQVKALAKKWRLPAASRPESQEICFTSEKTHYNFLKRHLKLKPGPIITVNGKIIGQHEGLPLYTLGQRKGIKIGGIGPFYVVRMNYKNNALIVSKDKDDPRLYTKEFTIKKTNWICGQPKWPLNCQVKIRYQAPSVKCQVNKNKVILSQPQRAITPGQSAVFYLPASTGADRQAGKGQEMLGGGVIEKIKICGFFVYLST